MQILRKKSLLLLRLNLVAILALPHVLFVAYYYTLSGYNTYFALFKFADDANVTTSTSQQQQQQQHYSSFIEALAVRADSDGYILLAMIDETFTDMALNFYEASLHAHSVNNFLFVGVGRNACQILQNNVQSIACFYYAEDPSAGRASSYGQRDFNRKMNIRTDMILEALAANFTVIHSDTDVAFFNNPLTEIKVIV